MGNIISSFLSPEALGSIFSFIGGQAKYVWDLKSNLDAFQTEFDKLIQVKGDLLNEVKVAEEKPRTGRTDQVKGWLKRVEEMGTKVAALQQVRDQEIDRLCLGGFCSKSLISTYNFGKDLEKLKEEVMALIDERGKIKDVAKKLPEAAAVALPIDQRTVVGQESIFNQVWRCIEDKQVGVIGLYGTGGVGKTTLLKRVNNNFLRVQHNFDVVIWSVVSENPKLTQIQNDIGKRIGLSEDSWKGKRLEEKAEDISNILSQKKFVLLLDDIWEHVDLTAVGVPLQSSNTSKIVFTTRYSDVCGKMQAKKLKVSSLAHDESFNLFQEVVGRDVLDSDSGIPEQANILARECDGLPLALITLGRTMASKTTLQEWENAILDLRALESEFSDIEKKVFSRLKFSYDNLPNREIKSCLLYCSLYPEDYTIHKEELVNYWVSEGLVDDLRKGYKNIYDLLHACLLEEETDDYVKLHDVIRDMTLWIACKVEKEEDNFLVRAGVQLTEAPNIEEWKEVKRISLMKNDIKSLTDIPTCPRLQTLLLEQNQIEMITDGFFQNMPSLKVLSLRGNCLGTELPSTISSLVSLQHLDLSFTDISGLPEELKALVNLRCLNLEYTFLLSRIPRQLMCSFSKLQVLGMQDCGSAIHVEEGSTDLNLIVEEDSVLSEDAEPLMKELLCLKHLNLISWTLSSPRAAQKFFNFPKLVSITQSLCIQFYESPPLNVLHLAYMMGHLKDLLIIRSNLEELKIDSTGEVEKVLQRGFRNLHLVRINFCAVKDLTWLAFLPNLKKLEINCCYDIEEIISIEKLSEASEIMGELNVFAQLESLILYEVVSLKSIYRNPLPFPKMKKIEVRGCPMLKKLPLNSSSAKEHQIVIEGRQEWWKELQWEDQATQNAFSTCFIPSSY